MHLVTNFFGPDTKHSPKVNEPVLWNRREVVRLVFCTIFFAALVVGLLMTFNAINIGIHSVSTGTAIVGIGVSGIISLYVPEVASPHVYISSDHPPAYPNGPSTSGVA